MIRVCIYPQCGWVGYAKDTHTMKHGQPDNLCPECHGTTEELTIPWARELLRNETAQSAWEPVEDSAQIRDEDEKIIAEIDGNRVIVWADDLEEPFSVPLELWDDIRLCRRVPAPAQGVPEGYRRAMRVALLQYLAQSPLPARAMADALAWLDAQPQPGQETP